MYTVTMCRKQTHIADLLVCITGVDASGLWNNIKLITANMIIITRFQIHELL